MPTYDCVAPTRDDAIVKPGTTSPACQRREISGAPTPSDRERVCRLRPKRRQCRIHRASGPEPVELRKRERAIIALNVVPYIQDEASVIAPVLRASQAPSRSSGSRDSGCKRAGPQ